MPASPNTRSAQLEDRLVAFAVRIVRLANALPKNFSGQHFGKQILRSGSAPALHYGEARGAESDKDFRHKCSIALKELRETYINLKIIDQSCLLETLRLDELLDETNQLISIFVRTVRTLDDRINQTNN
ncbi:four helix bundle protein [Lewinella marina]|uniref:Four helix bundle protein n=1 Tax=Neolewinella marina TaxID=438751 RepID=A0A2G0CK80_9BACT|nr:four helix bundle protein [Neolewinella marina]NJB84424.1 four helix bundle protein [Neolewinella marina]PHL00384.1 four helix bundle protein [Neolewinella marina]